MQSRSLTTVLLWAAISIVSAPTWAAEVIVDETIDIPQAREEIVTVQPSREHVWIPGYWERSADDWTWIAGHWDKPPHHKARWRDGHWSHEAGKWHWIKGHWGVGDGEWVVDEVIDVPYAIVETRPPAPTTEDHWVPGHWDWDAGWVWTPGYYTTLPDPKAVWVPGHWVPHASGGYWWLGGHWSVS